MYSDCLSGANPFVTVTSHSVTVTSQNVTVTKAFQQQEQMSDLCNIKIEKAISQCS